MTLRSRNTLPSKRYNTGSVEGNLFLPLLYLTPGMTNIKFANLLFKNQHVSVCVCVCLCVCVCVCVCVWVSVCLPSGRRPFSKKTLTSVWTSDDFHFLSVNDRRAVREWRRTTERNDDNVQIKGMERITIWIGEGGEGKREMKKRKCDKGQRRK
jgi:hypothetical protein